MVFGNHNELVPSHPHHGDKDQWTRVDTDPHALSLLDLTDAVQFGDSAALTEPTGELSQGYGEALLPTDHLEEGTQ